MNDYNWSVWTKVNGEQAPLGYEGGTHAIVAMRLTETQARDIVEHIQVYYGDPNVEMIEQ